MTLNLLLDLGLVTPHTISKEMTTKTTQFFSRLDEFLAILADITVRLGLHVILYKGGGEPVTYQVKSDITLSVVNEFHASRIYLAEFSPDMPSVDPCNLNPAAWGWIQVDLPKEKDSVLYMGQISIKSDWLDREHAIVRDNLNFVKKYNCVVNQMKKKFASPVVAENVVTTAKATYKNIYYLPSAKVFAETGGQLMQEGVKNVRFSLPE